MRREYLQFSAREKLTQTSLFTNASGFESWVDAQRVRFEDPFVYIRVRRHGLALFEHDIPPAQTTP